jgi:hypothetical protein
VKQGYDDNAGKVLNVVIILGYSGSLRLEYSALLQQLLYFPAEYVIKYKPVVLSRRKYLTKAGPHTINRNETKYNTRP